MNLKQVLLRQLDIIKPNKETFEQINFISNKFIEVLEENLKKKKISAEIFVGGSLAKKTLVKKEKYDVDIFVRFDEKYKSDEISDLLEKVIGKSAKRIHGSRDYFQLIIKGIILEVVPVIKIKKPEQAQNVTDLSYFHVKYILDKLKKDKTLADEIMLAKSFCHAQNCYGAESYIKGFSGYSLELLICHYKRFEIFLKEIVKDKKNDKIIIDDLGYYKHKNALIEMNESKLHSPIILIDPTFKERNALAGLSQETLDNFKKISRDFLKNPSLEFFKEKNVRDEFEKRNKLFNIIEIKTNKQSGDIAGTKSKKFYEFCLNQIKKEFIIKSSEFEYNEHENIAKIYLALSKKDRELRQGPNIEDKKNLSRFKKVHKKTIIKNKIIYAEIKHELTLDQFIKLFTKKEKKIIREMSIEKIRLIS